MAIGNWELMHEYFPHTLAHGNNNFNKNEIRLKKTDEECKKRGVSMERSKAVTS